MVNREQLREYLAAVGAGLADEWGFLLQCHACNGTWHPFDFSGQDFPLLGTLPEAEIAPYPDKPPSDGSELRPYAGLRLGYWECPNGCNAGRDLAPEARVLRLTYVEVDDWVGVLLSADELPAFKAYVQSQPPDAP